VPFAPLRGFFLRDRTENRQKKHTPHLVAPKLLNDDARRGCEEFLKYLLPDRGGSGITVTSFATALERTQVAVEITN